MQTRDAAKRSAWIKRALEKLNPREQVIIRERQMQDEGVTLEALGARLGISKERVRQIEANALTKLRSALIEQVGDPVNAGLIAA
jgi:RNA polymerase sigma-32 factor